MKVQYILRIDDICPTMNWDRFVQLQKLLKKYEIPAILGVIPENQDPKLMKYPIHGSFWDEVRLLAQNGCIIAQHGFEHKYVTNNAGLLKINNKSEFAGLSYSVQKEKITQGKSILEDKLGQPVYWWMAPAHSFDRTTCRILKELGFIYITDGFALSPFEKYGLIWVPQQLWKPQSMIIGLWTICIHPDSVSDQYIDQLDIFIERHKHAFLKKFSFVPEKKFGNFLYSFWWRLQYFFYKNFIK